MGIQIQRVPEQIQSQINRIKANIEQTKQSDHFTPLERQQLLPIYQNQLDKLERDLDSFKKAKI